MKVAIDKQPQLLTTVDNQEIKDVIQQMITGDEESSSTISPEHIVAINEWLDQISQEVNHKSPIQSTRFNQFFEIPRLERWFASDPNPSRQKLMSYMHLLNGSTGRRTGNKITYQQICNWFVNQRAILRNRQQHAAQQNQTILGRTNSSSFVNNTLSSNISIANSELALLRNSFSSLINSNANGAETSVTNAINPSEVTATSATTVIPMATLPVDIRSKFNRSNGYNPLLDQQSDGEVKKL